jgi:predicted nucleic acid-binding protein
VTGWVVDASVAAKWFFEEDLTGAARTLLQSGDLLLAPDLLLLEVGNVAWKRVQKKETSPEQARAIAATLPLVLSHMVPVTELFERAADLALRLGHPIYDCAYLALADARDLPFVTADRRLLDRAASGGWAGKAVHLADATPAS